MTPEAATPDPAGAGAMPAAEVDIDGELVRRLLADQHPDLAQRALVEVANGWDNVLFRLGDDLAVRLPRRRLAATLVEHEQRWLPVLAPSLPLPVPTPIRVGRPTGYYPWSWSILPWFEGGPAGADPAIDGPAAARDIGRFLAALHRPAPAEAPVNRWRGGPLTGRDRHLRRRLDDLSDRVDTSDLVRRWERCLAAPPWDGPPLWLHGDLHAHNIVSRDGRLVAVIDFGDITAGDPATDLAVAWSLLDPVDHDAFRAAADSEARPMDRALWRRAEGWALAVGVALLASSADNPAMDAMGRRMVGLT
jgi:aminoglycoside phosphotransferase (APT) family kinase protein